MDVVGKVVRVEIEGGFTAILGDDGRKYALRDDSLAAPFVGRRVRAAVERVVGVSVRMWGREVDLLSITPLNEGTDTGEG